MLILLLLLGFSLYCCMAASRLKHVVQRRDEKILLRLLLVGVGLAGLALGLVFSIHTRGMEQGVAVWLVCLSAAGLVTPCLAALCVRLLTTVRVALRWRRARLLRLNPDASK